MKLLSIVATLLTTATAIAQTPANSSAVQNKVWHYSLSGYEVDMTYLSDTTLRWQDKTRGETDPCKTHPLSDHTLLVGWYESDKTFVSLYSDFATGEAYCHVFRPDGKIIPMKGTLVPKK